MARANATKAAGHQVHGAGTEAVEAAQAQRAGAKFEWHFGRVTRMGNYEAAGDRSVTVVWEEGGVSSQQGNLTDGQWEVFKLAFQTRAVYESV